MKLLVKVVVGVVLSCAGPALAQTSAKQTQPSSRDTRKRSADIPQQPASNSAVQAAAMVRRTNCSLLQAQLAAQVDPSQVKPSQVSFLVVPEPEPKTLKRHDLVTIVIREESAISSKETKDFKKDAQFDTAVDQFVKLSAAGPSIVGLPTPPNPEEIKLRGNRTWTGQGDIDRTDSLTARITAEVVDVKPNGTLVLAARKRIKTDEEEQQFILTGTCRAEDITADNTILSTQLYDLELQKNHKGDVRDATKRGWIPKLLDLVNPF
jgi:flagellar L-ring protein precursor FlgH